MSSQPLTIPSRLKREAVIAWNKKLHRRYIEWGMQAWSSESKHRYSELAEMREGLAQKAKVVSDREIDRMFKQVVGEQMLFEAEEKGKGLIV